MIVLSLIFIGLLVLRYYKDKEFQKYNSLIELFAIFFAIWFSIDSIEGANQTLKKYQENTDQLRNLYYTALAEKSTMDSLSLKLSQIPVQLDQFSNSLQMMNSVVRDQYGFFNQGVQGLNENISGLKQGVIASKEYVNSFNSEISRIVELTDKQLKIWEEQQKIVLDEYKRRPVLELVKDKLIENDSSLIITDLILKNTGNIEAEVDAIIFSIPKKDLLKFDIENSKQIDSGTDYLTYQFSINTFSKLLSIEGGSVKLKAYIQYRRFNILPIISYTIHYSSRYKSGMKSGYIPLSNKSFDELIKKRE